MNKLETFQQFLATQSVQISVLDFVINLILAALMGYLLRLIYTKYGESISNRRLFAKNFVMIAVTTMIIISIVKSSLALSLGLVGALSIVRFRTAIKEPEELAYLFFTIGIGLGLGADQRIITVVGFIFIALIVFSRGLLLKKDNNKNLILSVISKNPGKVKLQQIIDVIKKYAFPVNMKRFDETEDNLEATFIVEFIDYGKLENCKNAIQSLNKSIAITFMDNKGLI